MKNTGKNYLLVLRRPRPTSGSGDLFRRPEIAGDGPGYDLRRLWQALPFRRAIRSGSLSLSGSQSQSRIEQDAPSLISVRFSSEPIAMATPIAIPTPTNEARRPALRGRPKPRPQSASSRGRLLAVARIELLQESLQRDRKVLPRAIGKSYASRKVDSGQPGRF